jgi:poly(A) polymerase
LRRLAALLPRDPALAGRTARRLKLSNAARAYLTLCATPPEPTPPRALGWRHPREAADLILLADWPDAAIDDALASLATWERPHFPLKGADLVALGIGPGPRVAAALQQIEQDWIAADFPDAAWVAARARAAAGA